MKYPSIFGWIRGDDVQITLDQYYINAKKVDGRKRVKLAICKT